MATTLFVGSVISDGGWTASSPGDVISNLGDFDNATYAAPPTGSDPQGTMFLRMGAVGLADYATVKSVVLKANWSGDGTAQASLLVFAPGIAPYPLAYGEKVPSSATFRPFSPMPLAPGGKTWSADTISTLQLQVWAQSPVHLLNLWGEADVDLAPTVTILSPGGTVSADSRPVIRWSMSDPEGRLQQRAQVRLFTQSAYAAADFNPETARAVRSWDVVGAGSELLLQVAPDAYALHIRASEDGANGRYGAWAVQMFTITGATPGTPALEVFSDPTGRRARLTVTRADNLLGYEQAGGGEGAAPVGWYADVNATTPTSVTAVATGTEGPRVVAVQSVAAGLVSMRAGGPLLTSGTPSPAPGSGGSPGTVTVDTANMPPRVTTPAYSGGDVTTAPFFAAAGTVLVALAGFSAWPGGGSVLPFIHDSSGLTWTQQALNPSGVRIDQAGVWTAVVPSGRTVTVTATATHNVAMKSLQVAPCLGVDTSSPVSSANYGASTGAPSASGTAPSAGALLLAAFSQYWGGTPAATFGPGTQISQAQALTTFAAGRSAPAPSAGSTLTVTISSPSTGVSWVYAWVVLRPAAPPAPPVAPPAPPSSSVASPWLAGVPVQAGKAYIGVGQAWQTAGATRHARLDVRLYDRLAQPIATVTGTNAATASGAMTPLPDTAFTPTVDGVAVLIAVCEDAAAGGETLHWDRLGIGPAGWRWSRGGVVAQNLMGWDDTALSGSPTWGSVNATSAVVAESVLAGAALQLTLAASPGPFAGPVQVPIPAGVTRLSAACIVKVSNTAAGLCGVGLRMVGADGAQLGWPGGFPVAPVVGGWTVLPIDGTPVPPGAMYVQMTVGCSGTLTGGDYARFAHMGIWATDTVPPAWNTGPGAETYPLIEYSDDGATWEYVRGTDLASYVDDAGMLDDYEICPGLQRQYRASTAAVDYRADPAGVLLVSAPSLPSPAWLPAAKWWLKDPSNLAVPLQIQVAGDVPFQVAARAAVFDVLDDPTAAGPQLPKVVYGRRSGQDHSLSLIVRGEDDWRALLAMLTPGGPLLLVGDMAEQWWVLAGDAKVVLKSSASRLMDPTRTVEVALTQIARPAQAARSV